MEGLEDLLWTILGAVVTFAFDILQAYLERQMDERKPKRPRTVVNDTPGPPAPPESSRTSSRSGSVTSGDGDDQLAAWQGLWQDPRARESTETAVGVARNLLFEE